MHGQYIKLHGKSNTPAFFAILWETCKSLELTADFNLVYDLLKWRYCFIIILCWADLHWWAYNFSPCSLWQPFCFISTCTRIYNFCSAHWIKNAFHILKSMHKWGRGLCHVDIPCSTLLFIWISTIIHNSGLVLLNAAHRTCLLTTEPFKCLQTVFVENMWAWQNNLQKIVMCTKRA